MIVDHRRNLGRVVKIESPIFRDLYATIPDDRGCPRFPVLIRRESLGRLGNSEILDRLGFLRHMKTNLSRSNLNLEMLVFEERVKPECAEKKLSKQGREPSINSTHMWRQIEPRPYWRRVLSPLPHPSWKKNFWNKQTVLTNAAALSGVTNNTITSVTVHGVDTGCSILTGLTSTIVDICQKSGKLRNMFKENYGSGVRWKDYSIFFQFKS